MQEFKDGSIGDIADNISNLMDTLKKTAVSCYTAPKVSYLYMLTYEAFNASMDDLEMLDVLISTLHKFVMAASKDETAKMLLSALSEDIKSMYNNKGEKND